jgi:undecaprenyl diphosphate synthase
MMASDSDATPPRVFAPLLCVPQHVGIIMDGNGRWAAQRRLPRVAGHRAGVQNIRPIAEACVEFGVKVLTIYAFSTENWGRPPDEVQGLLRLLTETVRAEAVTIMQNQIQLRLLGRLRGLPRATQAAVRRVIAMSRENDRLILNVAFNYGGRAELVDAFKRMLRDGIHERDVNEELVSRYLYTAGLPDVEFVIRTGGDHRVSNFLLWQAAYAEFYSTPTYWPEFTKADLYDALAEFGRRQRRFGLVEPASVPPRPAHIDPAPLAAALSARTGDR